MHEAFWQDIMVCNRVYDSASMQDVWRCTRVNKVSWHLRRVVSLEKKGLAAGREVSIRIDGRSECEKQFKLPKEYMEPAKEYTLQSGDKVFVLCDEDLEQFDWKSGKLPERQEMCCTVCSWADNRDGLLPHIYIQGE